MTETVKKPKAASKPRAEKKQETASKETAQTVSAKPKAGTAKASPVTEKATAPTSPKPRKAAAKSGAETKAKSAAMVKAKAGATQGPSLVTPSHITPSTEQIAQLAHRFWIERGRHHGAHEQDWLRAERELRGKAS